MEYYEATSDIKASPAEIWAILTDAQRLTRWDSGVERVEGEIAPGERVTVYVRANPGRAFPVRVTEFEPEHRMVWSGGMPLRLFKGVRTYSLEPTAAGVTRFTMREEYTGPLLRMIWRSIPDLGPAFQQFATGLKAEAESRSAAS